MFEVGASIQYSKIQVLPFGGKNNLIKKCSALLLKSFELRTGHSPETTVSRPLLKNDANTNVKNNVTHTVAFRRHIKYTNIRLCQSCHRSSAAGNSLYVIID